MIIITTLFCILLCISTASPADAEKALAPTPPMGWMSWGVFRCEVDCDRYPDSCINEKLYTDHADRMAEDGFLLAGYNRVHVDDCWYDILCDRMN